MAEKESSCLTLADGTKILGKSFGYKGSVSGELVFNTAMTGYPESLTDPSYKGQILVLTYPLIGNYGVPHDVKENGISRYYESDKIQAAGLVVADYSPGTHHWNSTRSLSEWLIENKIPAISGVDTRALTRKLRETGSMPAKMEWNQQKTELRDPNLDNLVALVSTPEVIRYGSGKHTILLVDCGVKNNIIRRLLTRDTNIIRVPWDYDYSSEKYDGILVSNGPGDPVQCGPAINHLAKAMNQDKPIFGICLGNQLITLAAGGETYKLKYGHRSHNQPVVRTGTNRCYITSQNHGFATRSESLGNDWQVFFSNLNDNTNEGIIHKSKPVFATQFHPEASSGPTDTDFLFDNFIELIQKRS